MKRGQTKLRIFQIFFAANIQINKLMIHPSLSMNMNCVIYIFSILMSSSK